MNEKISRSNWLNIDRVYNYALIVILGLALLVRLIGLNKGIWGDEYHSLKFTFKEGLFPTLLYLRDNDHPPLYFLLLKFWSQISNSEEFIRLLSLLFGMGTILVVMEWMKPYSKLASILAGVYLVTTPMMLRYSQEIRGYSLLVFATALAFYFASRLTAEPEKISGYVGIAFSLTVAISTHLVGIMLILPICVFIILTGDKQKIRWGQAIQAIAIPLGVFSFFYFFYLKRVQKDEFWWIPPVSFQRLKTTLQSLFVSSWQGYWPDYIDHLMIFILFAFMAIILVFGKWRISFPFLVAGVIYWLEVIFYSIFKTPVLLDRTVLPSIVPLSGFFALQIATIQKKRIKIALIVIFTVLSLLLTTTWVTKVAGKPYEEYKQVSQFVQSQWQTNDLVIFYAGVEGPVSYYFPDLLSEARIKVSRKADIKLVELELDKVVANIGKERNSFSIYLVARIPKHVRKRKNLKTKLHEIWSETYEELLSLLEFKFGQSLTSHEFGSMLIVTKYELRTPK